MKTKLLKIDKLDTRPLADVDARLGSQFKILPHNFFAIEETKSTADSLWINYAYALSCVQSDKTSYSSKNIMA